MKNIKFILLGAIFGIIMSKSEVISWYRIQEMFRFQSFHMYGVIGSALAVGALLVFLSKRMGWKTTEGDSFNLKDKDFSIPRYLFGGIMFGLGWAMTGACPGPIYVLIGSGFSVFIVVLLSALVGTWAYGALRDKLPH